MSLKKAKIPWRAWYGDKDYKLTFPEEWDVQVLAPKGARALTAREIKARIDAPIGSPPLSELAKGRRHVTIAVDDISRPTPAAKLLPVILARLTSAGVSLRDIRVIMGIGAHRPCTRQDLVKKLGEKVLDSVEVIDHHPFENLVNLGESSRGTPILINAPFMEGDLKLSVGCIIPHYGPGFGGGGKIVLPALAGIETLRVNHAPMGRSLSGGLALMDGNEQQEDMREVAQRAGLEFIVNVVVSGKRQIVGVFAGDLVQAHLAGIESARKVYSTEVTADLDVAVCNAYPKDTDFMQAVNAFNPLITSPPGTLKEEDATVVVTTASTEGKGYHSLFGRGMSLQKAMDVRETLAGPELLVFSPNIAEHDVKVAFHEPVRLFRRWSGLVKALRRKHGEKCRVGIFPCGPIQLAKGYDPEGRTARLIMR